jgi:hypothetical protein
MKILLTSGCSFTDINGITWPYHVNNTLKFDLINLGLPSASNGIIYKRTINHIGDLLKNHKPSNILVGIMWSGVDRHDFYSDDPNITTNNMFECCMENPTNVTVDGEKRWIIMDAGWKEKYPKIFYENFHSNVNGRISTMEKIIFLQLYFKTIGIKYFMTTFVDIFKYITPMLCKETEHFHNMIDFSKFLPVNGCYEWIINNLGENGLNPSDDFHPNDWGHKMFSEKIIIPYLCENDLIL